MPGSADMISNPVTCWTNRYKRLTSNITQASVQGEYPSSGGKVVVKYRVTDSETSVNKAQTISGLEFNITSGYNESIVESSVRFTLGGRTYIDRAGSLYYNISSTTGAGTYGGTIDYNSGKILIEAWGTGSSNSLVIQSLLTTMNNSPVGALEFRIPSAPVKLQSFQVRVNSAEDGTLLNAVSNDDTTVVGTFIEGYIDYSTGLVGLNFGAWELVSGNEGEDWYQVENIDPNDPTRVWRQHEVEASTMFYNAVSQTFLPLDESILGLNPVRLPQDGRIPIYSAGDVVVVLHDQITGGTFTNGTQTDLGRGRIAKVTVKDSAGNDIDSAKYSIDLDTGIIDWIDLTGVSQPIVITDRIEDMALLTDVQITGKLSLSQPLTHDFPVDETLVSNAVIFGDIFAHTSIPFDQQTWTGVWSDTLIGSDVTAQYNNTQHPITIDNASGIQERWLIQFTSSTTVNVIGEHTGQVLSGVLITNDIAPINPNTAQPYFTIPFGGWGGGWSSGNVLRFNTYAGNASSWIIESIGQGEATDTDYNFCIELRGDIDTII